MTSPPSSSEPGPAAGPPSQAFELLHPSVQRWIWKEHWTELRDAQEAAITAILDGGRDLLIAAATAAGKTEAAFLPIVSELASLGEAAEPGVRALYVGPLKALINDQFGRVEQLCEAMEIPVARWHGDVGAHHKRDVVKSPAGILLITPESLEAIFVNHGTQLRRIFQPLGHVVVDELHAFIGTERGRQMLSLLSRLEKAVGRRIPRIGLSATLGDMSLAAEFLRPGDAQSVGLIESKQGGQEIRLQVRGYRVRAPNLSGDFSEASDVGDDLEVAQQLFQLRDSDNLIFCNSRAHVETLTALLRQMAEEIPGAGEFMAHHGSLAKGIREDVEGRLKRKGDAPVTVVCTRTLEMGIDIGSVRSVAQVGAPQSVSSLRQRLGRSGRRGEPAMLRVHVQEAEVTPLTSVIDLLRPHLVQSIAMVELLLEGWCEPPRHGALHLSTLFQQVLAVISQHGGTTARQVHEELCAKGPFRSVDQGLFARVLRCMGERDLITQLEDGTLTLGLTGERIVNHYSFYVVFPTPEEFRVVHGSLQLGQILLDPKIVPGQFMILAGRRWLVENVDAERKTVFVTPRTGGKVPRFPCHGAEGVHDRVRERMRAIYIAADIPRYLDGRATHLLQEARQNFLRLGLEGTALVADGRDVACFPWVGDPGLGTLGLLLARLSLPCFQDGPALMLPGTDVEKVREVAHGIANSKQPTARELAASMPDVPQAKYEHLLDEDLRARERECRDIDLAGARRALQAVLSDE